MLGPSLCHLLYFVLRATYCIPALKPSQYPENFDLIAVLKTFRNSSQWGVDAQDILPGGIIWVIWRNLADDLIKCLCVLLLKELNRHYKAKERSGCRWSSSHYSNLLVSRESFDHDSWRIYMIILFVISSADSKTFLYKHYLLQCHLVVGAN